MVLAAYHRGEQYETVSAPELLAATVGITIFAEDLLIVEEADGTIRGTGQTDSQVSAKVVSSGMTTSYSLCRVARELRARLESARLQLDVDWVPREFS